MVERVRKGWTRYQSTCFDCHILPALACSCFACSHVFSITNSKLPPKPHSHPALYAGSSASVQSDDIFRDPDIASRPEGWIKRSHFVGTSLLHNFNGYVRFVLINFSFGNVKVIAHPLNKLEPPITFSPHSHPTNLNQSLLSPNPPLGISASTSAPPPRTPAFPKAPSSKTTSAHTRSTPPRQTAPTRGTSLTLTSTRSTP